MKYCILLMSLFLVMLSVNSQSNRVFSGEEAINFGIVDISTYFNTSWTTERSKIPGYFSLFQNATFIGYSDQINIDGYVKKYGNTSFLFPVGNGKNLRTLEISSPTKETDAYATAWVQGDPTKNSDPTPPYPGTHPIFLVADPISAVSAVGQWDWLVGENENLGTGSTGNGENIRITVSIPDMSFFAEAEELRLVGWNGSQWIDLSNKATASSNRENSLLSGTMIPGISAIGIGKIKSTRAVRYSPTILNNFSEKLLIHPNPLRNNEDVYFRIETLYRGLAHIIIYDLYGRAVANHKVQINETVNQLKIATQSIIAGHYGVKIIDANGNQIGATLPLLKISQ